MRSFPDLSPIGRLAGIDRIVRIDAPNLGVSEDSAKKILKKRLIDEYHITEDTDTKIFKACKTNLEIQKEDILNSQTGEDDILDGNNAPDAGAYEESPNKKNKPGNNPGQKTIKIGKKAKPRNKLSPKPNEASHQDVHLDGKFAYLNDGFVSKEKRMPSDQEIFWLYTVLEKTPDEIAKMFGGFESDIEKKCKDLD